MRLTLAKVTTKNPASQPLANLHCIVTARLFAGPFFNSTLLSLCLNPTSPYVSEVHIPDNNALLVTTRSLPAFFLTSRDRRRSR